MDRRSERDGSPLVTVVMVPRERFQLTARALETVYECTDTPFEFVCVDGNSPKPQRRYLEREAGRRGFTLIRTDRYLSPNRARNIGLQEVRTRYACFVDNDLIVTPGWLGSLVECAEATGAWVVGPLYFEGDPEDKRVHMAGGDITLEGERPHRRFKDHHRHMKEYLGDLREPLQRERVDYVEFHCCLVRMDALAEIGPFDEKFVNSREHIDLCLLTHEAGGEVWFEPDARVTYATPPPFGTWRDIPYFMLRWSEAWTAASLQHFCDKHGIDSSYIRRVKHPARRRSLVFTPARTVTRRVLGERADRVFERVLLKVETKLNRRMVRRGGPRPANAVRVRDGRGSAAPPARVDGDLAALE